MTPGFLRFAPGSGMAGVAISIWRGLAGLGPWSGNA